MLSMRKLIAVVTENKIVANLAFREKVKNKLIPVCNDGNKGKKT